MGLSVSNSGASSDGGIATHPLRIVLAIILTIAVCGAVAYWFKGGDLRISMRPGMTYVKTTSTPQRREVQFLCRDMPDKQKAANLLADLTSHLHRFVRRLHRAYPDDDRVTRLWKQYDPDAVYELEPNSKMTSYSFNKGEYIVFCIRSRDKQNKLVPFNILVFVGLHELSHIMTLTKGHDEHFWNNFRFLLAHAIKWKYYTDIDYASDPRAYCGTYITDTPLQLSDAKKYINYDEAVDHDDPLDPAIRFEHESSETFLGSSKVAV